MNPNADEVRRIAERLLARLEGIRRVYTGNPDRAAGEFRRIAIEHVRAELSASGAAEDAFAERLATEIQESLVPRYIRLAVDMNERERSGFGFGVAASAAGRLVITAAALLIVWVLLLRVLFVPASWPFLLLTISFPFWPDIAAAVYRAHHRRSLDEAVEQLVAVLVDPAGPASTAVEEAEGD
jgi:hypothetical protein